MPARVRTLLAASLAAALAACGGGGSDGPPPPECTVPADCPGQSTACATVTCGAGRCGVAFAAEAPLAEQTAGDCQQARCDGAGHQVSAPDDADVPADDGNPCTSQACEAGAPRLPPVTPGTACGVGGQVCDGTACVAPASCKDVLSAGASTGDGTYLLDPDGAGAGAPFQAWCDMTTDGGGWTLVTSVVGPGAVTAVGPEALVSPASAGNVTNRGMRLPGVSEILVVNDGRDAGFEEAFDRADKYAGVTGLGIGWDQVLSAFNEDSGAALTDGAYEQGVADGWAFDAARVNPTGCLQAPLRDTYGSGNYLMLNAAAPYFGIDIGLMWHHWGQELWLAGATGGDNAADLRCGQDVRIFESFWKGLYLR